MDTYNVTVYNDMGHLMISPQILSSNIREYVLFQANRYLRDATDKTGHNAQYYCLPEEFKDRWRYIVGNNIVNNIGM